MTAGRAADRLALTLYINGAAPHSIRAIETARRLCEEEFGSLADLEIAVPTLVRHMPATSRRLVGDRSDIGQLRQSLELGPPESIDEHATPGA